MNARHYMIIAKGRIITSDISSCLYNEQTHRYEITFNSGKKYNYNSDTVSFLKEPKKLNPPDYKIKSNGKEFYGLSEIYEFSDAKSKYWHICFQNGQEKDYEKSTLEVGVSGINNHESKTVHDYMKEVAKLVGLTADDGTNLLTKQYDKIGFVDEDKVLSNYYNPSRYPIKTYYAQTPIFPFGCNASQYKAVNNALNNQLSVIQGPPGTGKTQTILNIIANLLIRGKTIQVVSNNNSATANVLEKMASPEYDLGFLVAMLGNGENKTRFLEEQKEEYPYVLEKWDSSLLKDSSFLPKLRKISEELNQNYKKQEELAILKQTLKELEVEKKHFKKFVIERKLNVTDIKLRKKLTAKKFLLIWKECQSFLEQEKEISLFLKLKYRFVYGIGDGRFYNEKIDDIVPIVQRQFYVRKHYEITQDIEGLEKQLSDCNQKEANEALSKVSLAYLQAKIKEKYSGRTSRKVFSKDDLWKNHLEIQKEYPVVLSTTFSARSSLSKDAEFDYVIIDEASQVDVVTGALALSCAKNAVIVGDEKQLPNVVSREYKVKVEEIFNTYKISSDYDFGEKSLLTSICGILPLAPQTLLREHYRCHPKIIDFCNRKFYGGHLVIMTEDKGEEDVLSIIKTVEGNHQRDHVNQRQIDVVIDEVLPTITHGEEGIGIIAPYKDQVKALDHALAGKNIDVATVHKFQGREKESIIITMVDNEVTEFSDNPNLLNVAISRAKKRLCVVVSGNEQPKDSNVRDLIDYVEYNNVVVESSIYSIFDFLYKSYEESRSDHLKKYKRVSEYDSENLMYALISDVLHENSFSSMDVICHLPLKMLLRDLSLLNGEELRYAEHNNTHLDFLLYNKISKKPVLAIEVDGYHFHKEGTKQSERDKLKDRILEQYSIPLLRFSTNGSGERKKLVEKLEEVITLA